MRLTTFVAGLLLALCIAGGVSQPPAHPGDPGDNGNSASLGTAPAEAHWYFTCSTERMKHRHWLRGVTNTWKDIIVIHSGGKRYVRGTWTTFDWGLERVTNADRKTYGPC